MSFDADLPPSYDDVIVGNPTPTAPPPPQPNPAISVMPASPMLGFEGIAGYSPQHEITKEQQFHGYGSILQAPPSAPPLGPGCDNDDDRIHTSDQPMQEQATAQETAQVRDRREFVLRFTCPTCDCSAARPHFSCGCCSPNVSCLRGLTKFDSEKSKTFLSNYTSTKITDRHFRYFAQKPESNDEKFLTLVNVLLFLVYLVCTIAVYIFSPIVLIYFTIAYECPSYPYLKLILLLFSAVAITEALLRSSCYILHKLDRPNRAIKELEYPDAILVVLLVLLVIIFVYTASAFSCNDSLSFANSTLCCDPMFLTTANVAPSAWLVYEVLILAGVTVKVMLDF